MIKCNFSLSMNSVPLPVTRISGSPNYNFVIQFLLSSFHKVLCFVRA